MTGNIFISYAEKSFVLCVSFFTEIKAVHLSQTTQDFCLVFNSAFLRGIPMLTTNFTDNTRQDVERTSNVTNGRSKL